MQTVRWFQAHVIAKCRDITSKGGLALLLNIILEDRVNKSQENVIWCFSSSMQCSPWRVVQSSSNSSEGSSKISSILFIAAIFCLEYKVAENSVVYAQKEKQTLAGVFQQLHFYGPTTLCVDKKGKLPCDSSCSACVIRMYMILFFSKLTSS